ncbi:RF8a [Retroperitoneal fibromatosis-associated herpesvirus]|uniref:RF8a n=1 Tax=Retroperitoneal fibromatosis-associated herpesvirus TaxID=111469 RepID=U5NM23_9GAMA|nr:RF8a [Retroperitoneal fibromatosis-associated herpesvirus]AGY30732.1 RF8a [Retroperitoneal fibromatosis-associated herpesvirus]
MEDNDKRGSPQGAAHDGGMASADSEFSQNAQSFFSDGADSQEVSTQWRTLALAPYAELETPAVPVCDAVLDLTRPTGRGDASSNLSSHRASGSNPDGGVAGYQRVTDRSAGSQGAHGPSRRSRRRPLPREDDDYFYETVVGSKRTGAPTPKVETRNERRADAGERPQLSHQKPGRHTRTSAKVHLRQLQQALEEKDVQMCILAARLEACREQTSFLREMLMRLCQNGACPEPPTPPTN